MRFGIPGKDEAVKKESTVAGGPLDGFDGAVEAECELRICGVGRGRDYEEDVASGAQTGRAQRWIGVARRLGERRAQGGAKIGGFALHRARRAPACSCCLASAGVPGLMAR